VGDRSIISDPNIIFSVNCLQSAFVPVSSQNTIDSYMVKNATSRIINISRINKDLVDHRSKLDTLKSIARRGDNKRLTENDIKEWNALVNPYTFGITKQYTLVLNQCSILICTKSLKLVLAINKSCINNCKFSIKFNEEKISCLKIDYSRMRIDYSRMTRIYSLLLASLLTEQKIIFYKTKKNSRKVRKFTFVLHKQMDVVRSEIGYRNEITKVYEREASTMKADILDSSPKNLLLRDIMLNSDYRSSTDEILLELD
jgi:hypothetical protein